MNEKPRKAPAFQFYADDFISGTITMTNEERGAYIALLCIQWSKGYVSETDFNRISNGMPPHSQAICQEKFIKDANGEFKNARLELEREKQQLYRSKQSENAKKRWVGNADAMPPHIPNVCSPSPSPSSSPISKTDINHDKREEGDSVVTVRWIKPSMSDLLEEASRIGLPKNEVEKFEAYYESNGWKVGKNKMKSWKHAMAGWKSRWQDEGLKGYGRQLFGTSTPDDAAF